MQDQERTHKPLCLMLQLKIMVDNIFPSIFRGLVSPCVVLYNLGSEGVSGSLWEGRVSRTLSEKGEAVPARAHPF